MKKRTWVRATGLCLTPECGKAACTKGRCKPCYQREYMRRYKNKWRKKNRQKLAGQTKAWRKQAAPAQLKEAFRVGHLRRRFGLTVEQYEALLAGQQRVCAICLQPCTTGRRLAVDHCHKTQRIRGLLCARCNRAIGLLRDNPATADAAAAYLRAA